MNLFKATHFIDAYWNQGIAETNLDNGACYVTCNVDIEDIPFPDKYFDFVFSSHVLEDLRFPMRLCKEMSRVGKAGISMTPSPLVEFCRGTEASWRGYFHHNWFVYSSEGVLYFLDKNVTIEHLDISFEETVEKLIMANPWLAHTYHYWEGELVFQNIDYGRYNGHIENYPGAILTAIREGASGTRAFLSTLLSE